MDANDQSLYARLVNAGLGEAEAEEIVKSQKSDVDVDRLTKAMQGIKSAFVGDDEEEEEKEEETTEDDAIREATSIVDAVTKGADALLAEQRGQFEALSKAIILLTEEMIVLRDTVSNGSEIVQKSLTSTQEALNEPLLRKSVGDISVIPTPGESGQDGNSKPHLVERAIAEIRQDATSDTRKTELRKAISMLECGINPSQIATTYSIAN